MMLVPSMDALRIGYWRSAAQVARSTNGRNVSPKPYCWLNCAFTRSRILATLVISHLCTVVTCAEVCLLNTMCSAMRWRMMDIGSTRFAGAAPGASYIGAGIVGGGWGGCTRTGCGMVATSRGGAGGGGA